MIKNHFFANEFQEPQNAKIELVNPKGQMVNKYMVDRAYLAHGQYSTKFYRLYSGVYSLGNFAAKSSRCLLAFR